MAVASPLNEHVFGFDTQVEDVLMVCRLEGVGYLRKKSVHLVERKPGWIPSLAQPGSQGTFRAQWHGEADGEGSFDDDRAVIKERENTRLIEASENLGLLLKEQKRVVDSLWIEVRKQVAANDLQSDLLTQVRIFRQVDFPDSSMPKES